MRIIILIGLLLSVSSAWARNDTYTRPADIDAAASAFLDRFVDAQQARGYRVQYTLGTVDSRLRMAACDNGPAVNFSGDPWKTGAPRLEISCQGDRPWRLFVSTTVDIHGPALVAANPLTRGTRLTADMITTADVALNTIHRKPIRDRKALLGRVMARSVNAGTVLTPDLVDVPDAVSRGDHVVITARSGNFSVQTRGKALASGQVGDQVPIQNLASKRTVRGLITEPGHVEIPM